MIEYKTLDHYRALYAQNYRGMHDRYQLQAFHGEVLFAAIDARERFGWRFWKWWAWGDLIFRIEREHARCCGLEKTL